MQRDEDLKCSYDGSLEMPRQPINFGTQSLRLLCYQLLYLINLQLNAYEEHCKYVSHAKIK